MAEQDLKADVRQQTGYTNEATLSTDALDTAYRNAKRHIRVRNGLPRESDFTWFDQDYPAREEALYWWTCLFAKVQTGELDAQDLQVGAVETDQLLAKDDNEVTQWFRNARTAMRAVNPDQAFAMSSPNRRDYSDTPWQRGNSSSTGGPTTESDQSL